MIFRVVTGSSPVGGAKPQVSRLVCQVLKIALRRTCDFPFRRWPALRGSGLPQSVAEGSVEGFGGATVGEATCQVVFLGRGDLRVAELVGDLAGGEFAFRRAGWRRSCGTHDW